MTTLISSAAEYSSRYQLPENSVQAKQPQKVAVIPAIVGGVAVGAGTAIIIESVLATGIVILGTYAAYQVSNAIAKAVVDATVKFGTEHATGKIMQLRDALSQAYAEGSRRFGAGSEKAYAYMSNLVTQWIAKPAGAPVIPSQPRSTARAAPLPAAIPAPEPTMSNNAAMAQRIQNSDPTAYKLYESIRQLDRWLTIGKGEGIGGGRTATGGQLMELLKNMRVGGAPLDLSIAVDGQLLSFKVAKTERGGLAITFAGETYHVEIKGRGLDFSGTTQMVESVLAKTNQHGRSVNNSGSRPTESSSTPSIATQRLAETRNVSQAELAKLLGLDGLVQLRDANGAFKANEVTKSDDGKPARVGDFVQAGGEYRPASKISILKIGNQFWVRTPNLDPATRSSRPWVGSSVSLSPSGGLNLSPDLVVPKGTVGSANSGGAKPIVTPTSVVPTQEVNQADFKRAVNTVQLQTLNRLNRAFAIDPQFKNIWQGILKGPAAGSVWNEGTRNEIAIRRSSPGFVSIDVPDPKKTGGRITTTISIRNINGGVIDLAPSLNLPSPVDAIIKTQERTATDSLMGVPFNRLKFSTSSGVTLRMSTELPKHHGLVTPVWIQEGSGKISLSPKSEDSGWRQFLMTVDSNGGAGDGRNAQNTEAGGALVLVDKNKKPPKDPNKWKKILLALGAAFKSIKLPADSNTVVNGVIGVGVLFGIWQADKQHKENLVDSKKTRDSMQSAQINNLKAQQDLANRNADFDPQIADWSRPSVFKDNAAKADALLAMTRHYLTEGEKLISVNGIADGTQRGDAAFLQRYKQYAKAHLRELEKIVADVKGAHSPEEASLALRSLVAGVISFRPPQLPVKDVNPLYSSNRERPNEILNLITAQLVTVMTTKTYGISTGRQLTGNPPSFSQTIESFNEATKTSNPSAVAEPNLATRRATLQKQVQLLLKSASIDVKAIKFSPATLDTIQFNQSMFIAAKDLGNIQNLKTAHARVNALINKFQTLANTQTGALRQEITDGPMASLNQISRDLSAKIGAAPQIKNTEVAKPDVGSLQLRERTEARAKLNQAILGAGLTPSRLNIRNDNFRSLVFSQSQFISPANLSSETKVIAALDKVNAMIALLKPATEKMEGNLREEMIGGPMTSLAAVSKSLADRVAVLRR